MKLTEKRNIVTAPGLSLSLSRWDMTEPSGMWSQDPAWLVMYQEGKAHYSSTAVNPYLLYKFCLPCYYNKAGQSTCCVCHRSVCLTSCTVCYQLYVPRIYRILVFSNKLCVILGIFLISCLRNYIILRWNGLKFPFLAMFQTNKNPIYFNLDCGIHVVEQYN